VFGEIQPTLLCQPTFLEGIKSRWPGIRSNEPGSLGQRNDNYIMDLYGGVNCIAFSSSSYPDTIKGGS